MDYNTIMKVVADRVHQVLDEQHFSDRMHDDIVQTSRELIRETLDDELNKKLANIIDTITITNQQILLLRDAIEKTNEKLG